MRALADRVIPFVIVLTAIFALLLLLVWRMQERMVFQPPPGTWPVPHDVTQIEFTSDDGTPLFAYMVGRDTSGDQPVVIHFHGNAEVASLAIPWAREVAQRSGVVVVLAEYRGYAGIPGVPTYAASRTDALALWTTLRRLLGATPERTTVHGFSLGSAVAAELAAVIAPRALVLEAPFTSAQAMAARMGPLLRGPVWRLIARVHYDTRARVASLEAPVWVAHGDRDGVIPVQMGRDVHAAARRKGELLIVGGAGHNDLRMAGDAAYERWLESSLDGARRGAHR